MLNLIQLLSNYVVIIPLALCVLLFKKGKRTHISDILTLILITSFLSDQVSYIIGEFFGTNYWVINIYVLISIVLIGLLFRAISTYNKIITVSYSLVLVVFVISLFKFDFNLFNGIFLSFYSLINIVFCVVVFYEFFNNQDDFFIDKKPEFWFISGLLFYSAGSFFTFGFSHEILSDRQMQFTFLHISNIINIFLTSIGLWRQMN